MKQQPLRAYFGSIFFEFVLQDRMADAVIILTDFPTKNEHNEVIELFYERGYHVFVPFYRGSYQSEGVFLSKSPVSDLMSFIQHLNKGNVKEIKDMKKINFKINKKLLFGEGFGSVIACSLAAKQNEFSHLILSSPFWDFQRLNEKRDELDLNALSSYVKRAYKNCYRFKFGNIFEKLKKFQELKPEFYLEKLQEIPVLIFHDPNDKLASFKRTKEMMEKLPKSNLIEHYFGYGSLETAIRAYWKEFDKFVKINYIS